MISGCEPDPASGINEDVPGLRRRLVAERLEAAVDVRLEDFMDVAVDDVYDALWTSGCLQYSRNADYPIETMVDHLREFVGIGGLAHFDYMVPDTDSLAARQHCPSRKWWSRYLSDSGWELIAHQTRFRVRDVSHPYVPYPHTHSWGYVTAVRRG
jgi:hypothetical protein